MYKLIGPVSEKEIKKYNKLLKSAKWKHVLSEDRDFYTSMVEIEGANIAFLLKIPPSGKVHRHTDTPRKERTYHIPLITNDKCISYTYNPNTETHLKVGFEYEINRQIEHESVNNGETDRIHLIIEK